MPDLRERLLRRGFGRYEGAFAGGQQANNKFDFESVYDDPNLYAEVVRAMGHLITDSCTKPDLIVPVPRGANRLGRDLACARGIGAMMLHKDSASREISFRGELAAFERFDRIAIVEDVPNRLTSVCRVLALPGVAERTVAVFGVLDRGDADRPSLKELASDLPIRPDIEVMSLIEEPIPPILPADSELWQYVDRE